MNKAVTTKEEILEVCKQIVASEGISSINMRTVATKCQIALGSLYNYFPSKAILIASTVQAVWTEIFHMDSKELHFDNICDYLDWLFKSLNQSKDQYPGFFSMHAIGFASNEKSQGRKVMNNYFDSIKHELLKLLNNDKHIKSDLFKKDLTYEIFADYIFTLVLSIMVNPYSSGTPLIQMINSFLYE